MSTQEKRGCSASLWIKTVLEVCAEHETDPGLVLGGSKLGKYVALRWIAWRRLSARNFSYSSIGKVSGYDHTSVRYGCRDDVREKHRLKMKSERRQVNPISYLEAA